jgi:hypothetical protein
MRRPSARLRHVQARLIEIQPTIRQVGQQLASHGGILRGALPDAQDGFSSILADSQPGHHLLAGEQRRIDPVRSANSRTAWPYLRVLSLSINFTQTASVSGAPRWNISYVPSRTSLSSVLRARGLLIGTLPHHHAVALSVLQRFTIRSGCG